ncbi:MAG TPA: c-type cytochrome [Anaerolineales bacterium]
MTHLIGPRSKTLSSFVFASVLFLGACTALPDIFSPSSSPLSETGDSGLANGERIYFTGTNAQDERIPYAGGPNFGGMMMGSYLNCAACHGPEARGGEHVMHMQVMDAPDIRYSALSGEAEGHADEEGDLEHAEEHADYDLEDFRLAVVEGQHPDGEPFDKDMPRWQMGDDDLSDLFDFLKSISE